MAEANRKTWTKEQSREAVRRYAAGEDATPLAREYGTTRNAVMGAVHRAGVSRKKNGASNSTKRAAINRERRNTLQRERRKACKVKRANLPSKPKVKLAGGEIKPSLKAHPVGGVGVAFMDATGGQCRWPVSGEGSETRFCGDSVEILPNNKKTPYCAAHRQQGTEARKRRPIHSELDAPLINHTPGGW